MNTSKIFPKQSVAYAVFLGVMAVAWWGMYASNPNVMWLALAITWTLLGTAYVIALIRRRKLSA